MKIVLLLAIALTGCSTLFPSEPEETMVDYCYKYNGWKLVPKDCITESYLTRTNHTVTLKWFRECKEQYSEDECLAGL